MLVARFVVCVVDSRPVSSQREDAWWTVMFAGPLLLVVR